VKRTAMPDHNRPRLRSAKDHARMRRLLVAHANSGALNSQSPESGSDARNPLVL
jgi:hypothetical protein